MMNKKDLSLYLHFPFCMRKCRYCDFLSWPADDEIRAAYVRRLAEEIRHRSRELSGEDYIVKTVFFGGGTPSIMSGDQMKMLMETIKASFEFSADAEVTCECNPGTVDAGKLKAFRAAGINRLSFGLQSMDDEQLAFLGRIHRTEDFVRNYEAARETGFTNINIDLMSALPGQSLESWEKTLLQAVKLSPEHISAYSLIIEPGTPFYDIYGDEYFKDDPMLPPLPDDDTERAMYHLTGQLLAGHGFRRYEISNYAKDGYECRHNVVYWTMGDYLGLGLGAAGKHSGRRFKNTDDLETYMRTFAASVTETFNRSLIMEETMFLGLRMMRGVSLAQFKARFGVSMEAVYGSIMKAWQDRGCLEVTPGSDPCIRLTEKGIDVSNQVMADFLLSS